MKLITYHSDHLDLYRKLAAVVVDLALAHVEH
jgi:hypothetical protein